jgi:hypothetical protein
VTAARSILFSMTLALIPLLTRCSADPRVVHQETSVAGGACANDTACNELHCDTSRAGGFCTRECTNQLSQADEQRQCGGFPSTCLRIGDNAELPGFCTRACNPTIPGSCRPGYVCTGWWYTHAGRSDVTGCQPFCSNNAHCPQGRVCNVRTGACQTEAIDLSRLPDGARCTIPTAGQPSPCRGYCFRTTTTGTTGVCGSLIDLSVTRTCPDSAVPQPQTATTPDNLGLCLPR